MGADVDRATSIPFWCEIQNKKNLIEINRMVEPCAASVGSDTKAMLHVGFPPFSEPMGAALQRFHNWMDSPHSASQPMSRNDSEFEPLARQNFTV